MPTANDRSVFASIVNLCGLRHESSLDHDGVFGHGGGGSKASTHGWIRRMGHATITRAPPHGGLSSSTNTGKNRPKYGS